MKEGSGLCQVFFVSMAGIKRSDGMTPGGLLTFLKGGGSAWRSYGAKSEGGRKWRGGAYVIIY